MTKKIKGISGNVYQEIDFTPRLTGDAVHHPAHYLVGGMETIDFIEAKELSYCLGNAVKYISRAEHKGNKKEDIEKAIWYLNRELSSI